MKIAAEILARRRELARELANNKYEKADSGLLFPRLGSLFIGGHMDHWLNYADGAVDPNIIPTEGLNHILSILVAGGTQVNPWYVSIFSGNVTPGASLTAATYTATCTEFTSYSESTRVAYVDGSIAAGAVDNDASRAEFTMSGSGTIYGGALLSASAKSSTSGTLLAAVRFSSSRAVVSGDTLQVKYTLSATSS